MSSRRILVIGSNGLLGQKVADLLVRGSGGDILLTSIEEEPLQKSVSAEYAQLDVTSKRDVKRVLSGFEPDAIINCAAMTNVDACETQREVAWKLNVEGVENLIEISRRSAATIFHVSSDYVFDGKSGPYSESDKPEPLSYYGKTKLASENVLRSSGVPFFIARTMILYGFASGVKPNFALWLIQSLEKNTQVRIVDDQFGNPTLADDLAYGLIKGMELGRTGIYNIAGREILSRFEFARRLAKVFGFDPTLITPIKTSQLHQPAPRPLKSGLITLKAEVELGIAPSTVEQGLLVLKNQLSRNSRKLGDSAPVPGQSRSSKR